MDLLIIAESCLFCRGIHPDGGPLQISFSRSTYRAGALFTYLFLARQSGQSGQMGAASRRLAVSLDQKPKKSKQKSIPSESRIGKSQNLFEIFSDLSHS